MWCEPSVAESQDFVDDQRQVKEAVKKQKGEAVWLLPSTTSI